jgi:5-methylcytosine-specific restriction endonuclease McrA
MTVTRSTPEWIGKTPDTPPPPRVKLRIFEAHGGKCYVTGRKLSAGEFDFDHIIALCNGGENRESNLAPIWKPAHKEKTAQDVAQKSKDRRVRQKHLGISKPKSTLAGSKGSKWKRKIDGTVVPR